MSIILGLLLGYLVHPLYLIVHKKIKNENLSALLICLSLSAIIVAPVIIFFNALMNQIVSLYLLLQTFDLAGILATMFPSFLSTLSQQLTSLINSFIPSFLSNTLTALTNVFLDLPIYLLKFFVVIFVFFFTLRDGERIVEYLKSLSPLAKDTEKQFFNHFRDITYSVLVGQIVVGVIQGAIAGIGYFIFGVPGAVVLTLLTMIVGIIPMIGPWLVWVPVDFYLFSIGETNAGMGLLIYGLFIVSLIDNILRPLIVSRRTKIHSAVVIIGLIGGMMFFGAVGIILGPLILSYAILVLELYRKTKETESIFFKQEK
jgi:predicted PurR-regulated permease PerM